MGVRIRMVPHHLLLPPLLHLLLLLLPSALSSSAETEESLGSKEANRTKRQFHFNFPILNRLFGHGHSDDHDDAERVDSTATEMPERIADVRDEESSEENMSDTVDTPSLQGNCLTRSWRLSAS